MVYTIAVLPGDGIGPEVVRATVGVLDNVQDGFSLKMVKGHAGAHLILKKGTNLPNETLKLLKKSDACLKGPMTTPDQVGAPVSVAVRIRKHFSLYANVRPAKTLPYTKGAKGMDLVIVRENTEGMYAGKERRIPGGAIAERVITRTASRRVAAFALKLAYSRRKKLVYVHKSNILRMTDGVFIRAVQAEAQKVPSVDIQGMHVDAAALQLIKRPEQFDVLVTTNLFGDILSDEAAQVSGGVGLAPSANIGKEFGMFEPVHGSAPKYAGKNIANPIATIRAAGMMLEYLGEKEAALRIEKAVVRALRKRIRTRDIGGTASTKKMGEAIAGLV